MREILELSYQYGFPVVMCLLIYIENNRSIDALKESLNKNTDMLEKILITLKIGGD